MKILAIIEAIVIVIRLLVSLGIIKVEEADKAVVAAIRDITKDIA